MFVHKYLKSIHLSGEIKRAQLDHRLMKSLDEAEQIQLEMANIMGDMVCSLELYSIPKTLRQASLLFSRDYQRIAASSEWISRTFKDLNTNSLVDMGCGYGVLLGYLNKEFPDKEFMGIDKSKNLVQIGRKLTGIELIADDYLRITPPARYETIVCDFGFDLADLELPNRSHISTEIGGVSYCKNCCSDFKTKFFPFISSWRNWGTENSNLIMTGRLTVNSSYLLATLQVANELNWNLNLEKSTCLTIHDKRTKRSERFPGLVFETSSGSQIDQNFIEISKLLYPE